MKISLHSSSWTSRRLALMAVSALAVAVIAGCSGQAAENAAPPPPAVGVAPVLVKNIQQWDEFSGRVEAVQTVELRPRVSGYIDKVNYVEGQELKQGDVLFTIDARSYRAELARAQAELSRARSQATLSRSESERAGRLAQQQAIATEAVEQRRSAEAEARANVEAAQAAVDQARLNLEWTQVRAPIAGRAGRALVTAGNLVTAGDAASVLTTLVSLDTVHVHFDADEGTFQRYVRMALAGQRPGARDTDVPVHIGLVGEDGYPHQGHVDFVDNQVARSTGTIRVRAVLDNQDRSFTPGLFARVRLLGSGEMKATLIDERSVMTDQDRKYVYVVDKDGKAQRRDVVLGRPAEGLRIVDKGLASGDRVIIDGVQKVFMPGMPVDAKPLKLQSQPARTVAAAGAH